MTFCPEDFLMFPATVNIIVLRIKTCSGKSIVLTIVACEIDQKYSDNMKFFDGFDFHNCFLLNATTFKCAQHFLKIQNKSDNSKFVLLG